MKSLLRFLLLGGCLLIFFFLGNVLGQRSISGDSQAVGEPTVSSASEEPEDLINHEIGQNLKLRVQADKTEVFQDEPILLTYELLTRYDTRYEGFEMEGNFRGFWIERSKIDKDSVQLETITEDGKKFVKATIAETRIFPLYPGQLTVDPGLIKVSIKHGEEDKEREWIVLQTKPILINVKANENSASRFLTGLNPLPPSSQPAHENSHVIFLLDVSGSMLAEDIGENRLSSFKKILKGYLDAHPKAQIGIKAFAGETKTVFPLSKIEREINLDEVTVGMIPDGTALGDAIFEAVKELQTAPAGTKAIVILTDSNANNAGHLDPATAADFCKERGIAIYAIGTGKKGLVPFPIYDEGVKKILQVEVNADHKTMEQLASETNGMYIKTENEGQIKHAFKQIQKALNI